MAYMYYKAGLADDPATTHFRVVVRDEAIILDNMTTNLFADIIKTYKIPLANVIACEVVREEQLVNKTGAVSKGLVGGFLFGPAGLVLGGLSGTGTKKGYVSYLGIAYVSQSEPGVLKNFLLAAYGEQGVPPEFVARTINKALKKVQKSQLVLDYLKSVDEKLERDKDGSFVL